MADLIFAIAHHLAIVALIVLLGAEFALVRKGLSASDLPRLAGLDMAYGITAGVVVVVGVSRITWAAKGWEFYLNNHWFWGKMAAFVLIGLLSIPPTMKFLKWRKAAKADPAFTITDADIADARRYIHIEIALLAVVVACAAAMARSNQF